MAAVSWSLTASESFSAIMCAPTDQRVSSAWLRPSAASFPEVVLKSSMRPDGTPVFTLPMVIGLLIFYAYCLQCAATLAIIRRETNSWRWPVFAWTYMTVLGYSGAFLIYQVGSQIG